jgi:GntR family transcriptional repressor for pyruvate dehydrogenase complex
VVAVPAILPVLKLDPVAARRAHEYAAEELRRLILLRVVRPGQRLPSELELGEALDISHVTVRAALRLLEEDGLLEIRRGRLGGAYITGVPPLGASPVQVGALQRSADALRHTLELRRLIEPAAGAAAAERASAKDLRQIRQAQRAVADAEEAEDHDFMAADTAFHLELARASSNPQFVELIERVLSGLAPALAALPESGPWHNRSVHEHERIVDAVAAGDGPGASAAMSDHIGGTERAIEVLLRGLVPAKPQRARTRPAA